uniref:Telomerase RNA component interacting RNase n=1 Tax=Latimeria chalumnae TaxID=7897 RepID=H3AKC4_LATCH
SGAARRGALPPSRPEKGQKPLGPTGRGGGEHEKKKQQGAGGAGASQAAASLGSAAGKAGVNVFANDGSFLELFKKKMEEEQQQRRKKEGPPEAEAAGGEREAASSEEQKKKEGGGNLPTIKLVGKRRAGTKLALKTGMVAKKQKTEEEVSTAQGDAWAKYMAEVKKYKAHQCYDDDKTRPLVK